MIAGTMAEACAAAGAQYVFKASFDKANRTSVNATRGLGLEAGLKVLAAVRAMGMPVLTDVHDVDQARAAATVVDILQIPAFLCRQTDLLLAAGQTGVAVNIKKGQFLDPGAMGHVAAKVASTGNDNILLTERGVCFGYNALVVDMRGLPIMARTGYPVIMDATHAVQQPGGQGDRTAGQREFAPVLARAAVSLGIAGVFIETHQDPDNSPSDGPNMIALRDMSALINSLMAFDRLAKLHPLRP
jgi:2-dehydro-3-deoxyphosphooctonate aldolase (KDO 8-P synthase)